MRVTKLIAPLKLETVQEEAPKVAADGILLQVAACGLTDSDIKAYQGEGPCDAGVPGGQIAGIVMEVGKDAQGYCVGDRVLASRYVPCGGCKSCQTGASHRCGGRKEFGAELRGGLAEILALDGPALKYGCIVKIPKNLTFEEACAADVAAAVFRAHCLCGVAPGQKILVLGCGPAGCMHTHIAKLRGADVIIQADVVSSRMEMSRPFMADCLVNTALESLDATVEEATNGCGADISIVAASDPAAMETAIAQTVFGGKILLFSHFGEKGRAAPVNLTVLQRKQIQILGSEGYTKEDIQEVLWLASKRKINLKWLVTSAVGVDEAAKKIDANHHGKELRVVVHPQS